MLHKGIKIQLIGIVLLLSAIFMQLISCGEWSLFSIILSVIGILVFVIGLLVD